VQRVSALETDMAKQNEAMNQLREYSQRTEYNLSRLISGVDRLTQELPKRLAAPAEPIVQAEPVAEPGRVSESRLVSESRPVSEPRVARRRSSSSRFNPKIFWMIVALVVALVIGAFQVPKLLNQGKTSAPAPAAAAAPAAKPAVALNPSSTAARMAAAAQYAENKDYALAENAYKDVLKAEPNNVDARKALASVLYREDKIEESAAELEKLPRN
jgi:cytochrome c-type biogenesis protein CcmH/NrfG